MIAFQHVKHCKIFCPFRILQTTSHGVGCAFTGWMMHLLSFEKSTHKGTSDVPLFGTKTMGCCSFLNSLGQNCLVPVSEQATMVWGLQGMLLWTLELQRGLPLCEAFCLSWFCSCHQKYLGTYSQLHQKLDQILWLLWTIWCFVCSLSWETTFCIVPYFSAHFAISAFSWTILTLGMWITATKPTSTHRLTLFSGVWLWWALFTWLWTASGPTISILTTFWILSIRFLIQICM